MQMSGSETILPFSAQKSNLESSVFKAATKEKEPKRVLVLDMGEASREEGFRLNGCR